MNMASGAIAMSSNTGRSPRFAALEQTIQEQVVLRTWGRIRMLQVEVSEGGVSVRGSVPSYYVKQLALQGIFEAIGAAGVTRIAHNIHVTVTRRDEKQG
jgi:hypothetical protein